MRRKCWSWRNVTNSRNEQRETKKDNGKQKIIGNDVTNGDRVKSVFFFPMFNFALPLVPRARSLFPVSISRFPFQ